jgi:hopene-associated glycosyltransferase HpnB
MLVILFAAAVVWLAVLMLPWQPHRTRERLVTRAAVPDAAPDAVRNLGDVTVLIPARDEAAVIERTLAGLAVQGPGLEIVVVDDRSKDGTSEICRRAARRWATGDAAAPGLRLIEGDERPRDWSGKLWALEQGLRVVDRPRVLLLDADIELEPGVIAGLLERAAGEGAALVSVMATLRCCSFWERLLVPPFVYFFKLIYPFARVNEPCDSTAAAAGGCILIETAVLRGVAFEQIRGALIDDCTLARAVKRSGHGLWLGLSRAVASTRPYTHLEEFAGMVRRTAFTQLGYSSLLLVGVTLAMLAVYVVPLAGLAVNAPGSAGSWAAIVAVSAMYATYAPIVRFYKLNPFWVLTLPIAAAFFLWMTWMSAIGHWRGTTAQWKNRAYETEAD